MAGNSEGSYQQLIQQMNQEDLNLIANIKRFFECVAGDPEFSDEIERNADGCSSLLKSRGIFKVDPQQLMVFVPRFASKYGLSMDDLEGKPQALLWYRWSETLENLRREWRKRSDQTPSKRFNHWHRRQMNRCRSQLGKLTSEQLIHATIVFELTRGCSLQCKFCGLAAEPLKAVFRCTEENRKLWNDVLDVAVKHLGDTVSTGVCYWATDPTDNPDYLKFAADFGAKTGIYPQTTTSAPLRDLQWTRSLLEFRRKHNTSVDRFSLLSVNALRRIHKEFTAEELTFSTMVLQYTETMKQAMASSGRNRHKEVEFKKQGLAKDHTIACVSGYLVNMAEGTVRLISPCAPSERAPLGYLVYDQGKFTNAKELDLFIEETMEQCMPEYCPSEEILAFRSDLEYVDLADGFQLANEYKLYKMEGKPYLKYLGTVISQGSWTYTQIMDEMAEKNVNVLSVISTVNNLYDQGLLADRRILHGGDL